jgi:mono/diheme cytochrome c family protein
MTGHVQRAVRHPSTRRIIVRPSGNAIIPVMRGLLFAICATMLHAGLGFAAGEPEGVTEGRVLYTRYCAACHGVAADGNGPIAPVLREQPTDLRRLSGRYGTPLASDEVARFIDGRTAVTAHGPREMPVWGERFAAPEPEGSGRTPTIDARIRRIVDYLRTIQVPDGRR